MRDPHGIDLGDAVRAIAVAWDPAPPMPARDEDELEWNGDDCGCGGEDDSGRPICTCNDACICEQCIHRRHAERRHCSVSGCGAPSELEVRAWTVSHHLVEKWQVDPTLTRANDGYLLVEADETPRRVWSQTACTYLHAKQIIDAHREWRAGFSGWDREMRYEVVRFLYEPDHLDLPEILYELREAAHSLEFNARELARAGCEHTEPDAMAPDLSIEGARRAAAQVVFALSALSTYTPEPRRFAAGDPEPDDVRGVLVNGKGVYLRRRAGREVVWQGPSERLTWHELTALEGVVEYPHARLVIEEGA